MGSAVADRTKVVICGAGIAGLALALRLDELGWDVVMLEKASAPRTQGYMIDFFGPGHDAARAMGLLPRLRGLAYDVQEVAYVDERGRRRVSLPYARVARAARGRLLSLMRPDLELALRERLPGTVDLRFSTSITELDDRGADGVHVTLTGGTTLTADLLVGADGVHSVVRALAFGDQARFVHHLGFHTAAFTFDDAEIHAEVGGRFCITDTVDRQVGLYGLRDGRVAAFAVHRTCDPALPDDPRAAVLREYGSLGWLVPRALAHCPAPAELYYDQVAQVRMPRWSRGRITLVGDACYAVSLLAGQGASLALAGAHVLAAHLARTRPTGGGSPAAGSIEAALDRYEEVWRPATERRQQAGRRAASWFVPRSPAQLRIRRLVVRAARLPFLDRYIATRLIGKPAGVLEETAVTGPAPGTRV